VCLFLDDVLEKRWIDTGMNNKKKYLSLILLSFKSGQSYRMVVAKWFSGLIVK
jgi:hypothetical protein